MQFFVLLFQIQKIFHVLQGWNLIFFVYNNNRMAGLGRTPEETCGHDLLRLPLQSQVKCSVFAQGHCSLCWGGKCCCDTHGGKGWEYGGRQNVCKNSWWAPQLHGDLAISLWLTQPWLNENRGCTHRAGHARPHSTQDMPELCLPLQSLQCQALLWDQICGAKDWLQAVTQAHHYLYGHSAPAAFWPLLTLYPQGVTPLVHSSVSKEPAGCTWSDGDPCPLQWVSQLPNLWPFSHIISCHKDNGHLNGDKSFYKLFGPLLFHLPGLLFKRFYFVFQLFIYFRLSGTDEKILSISEFYR